MQPLLEILPYSLADNDMMAFHANQALVWRVSRPCIVLGQGNRVLESVNPRAISRDGISVYRRPSGGQAVLLSSRTVQISIVLIENRLTNPLVHFQRINRFLAEVIEQEVGLYLVPKGISDLATADERKVLGSSMYRSHGRVAYHGVLNLGEEAALIRRYLLHPPQEPDYRRGRNHEDFVTSLAKERPQMDEEAFVGSLKYHLEHGFFQPEI